MAERNELDLDNFIDFDLEELEELEGFVVPAPGVYTFEGISLGQEIRSVKLSKEDATEVDVTVAVARFKINDVVELANAKDKQEDIIGKELIISMQLEQVDDGFYHRKQQGQMAFLTKPLKAAAGVSTFKELVHNFPGMVFSGVVANRKRKDKDTDEIRVNWELAKPVIPS